jgi:hypothetical protein
MLQGNKYEEKSCENTKVRSSRKTTSKSIRWHAIKVWIVIWNEYFSTHIILPRMKYVLWAWVVYFSNSDSWFLITIFRDSIMVLQHPWEWQLSWKHYCIGCLLLPGMNFSLEVRKLFQEETQSANLQLPSWPHMFWQYFSTHDRALILTCCQFLFKCCHSMLAMWKFLICSTF